MLKLKKTLDWLKDMTDFNMDTEKGEELITMPTDENEKLFKEVTEKMKGTELSALSRRIKSLEDVMFLVVKRLEDINNNIKIQQEISSYMASIMDGSLEHQCETDDEDDEKIEEPCDHNHEEDENLDFEEELFKTPGHVTPNKKLNLN